MDFMIQFSGAFRRQLFAVGRFVPVSIATTAKAATARFKVRGSKAAVRKLGEVMLTPRLAETMAMDVNQSGQRDFQKISSIRATQISTRPNEVMIVSKREFGIPASCSIRSSSGFRSISFGTSP